MRIAHFSDVHWGFRSGNKSTPGGINQREHDVAMAMRRAAKMVAEDDPDLVLFAGDLFHTSRPPNAVVTEAYRRMREIARTAHVLICGGNHDSPRTKESGNILHLFGEIAGVRVVVDEPEVVTSEDMGMDDCAPWAALVIPHHGERAGQALIDRADVVSRLAGRHRILLLHAALEGQGTGALYGGHGIPVGVLRPERWDYIAAGDYHIRTQLAPMAWYAGSVEFVSTNPWEESRAEEKGYLLVDLRTKEVTVRPTHPRTVVDLPAIDAAGMDGAALMNRIRENLDAGAGDPEGKVIRQVVANVPKAVSRELDWAFIREVRTRATHYQLDLRRPEKVEGAEAASTLKGVPLIDLIREFVGGDFEPTTGVDRTAVMEAAVSAFRSLGDHGGEEVERC